MITISGVSKSFNGNLVLDGISLHVPAGELAVLMGLSGTGKSVLLQHMIGLIAPDAGSIRVDGTEVIELSERQLLLFRRKMGYLFQDNALYDFMTAGENLAFPLKEHTQLSAADIHTKVGRYLKMVDMQGVENKFPAELSGGMRKRVALARALIMDAKVLLCDEPTSGLDPIRSRDISKLIRDLSKKTGCTTIVTTHDMMNAFRIADRAFVLDKGKIVAQGTEKELKASAELFVQEFLQDQ